jgi:hypothetical protein
MSSSNLAVAEWHALRAVSLSPHNYKYRLTLASVKEQQGDFQAAEQSLRQATALAPFNATARLRLAKLLADEGRVPEAAAEFRRGTVTDPLSVEPTLDFVWRISKGDVRSLESATNDDPRSQLLLAHFLRRQNLVSEAARVFGGIKDMALIDSPEGAGFLNDLLGAGHTKVTHDLWLRLVGSDGATLVWNGSFEQDPFRNFTHFDWRIESSDYARVAIDPGSAHTGSRSLRIDFLGRDTTLLRNELKQLLLVQPGSRYRLQCYARAAGTITAPGPRVVVTGAKGSVPLGASAPIAAGANDWQLLTVDFLVPQSESEDVFAVVIGINRTPEFSYDDPTRGAVWFDDFTLTKVGDKR